jgi:hypothetical protein
MSNVTEANVEDPNIALMTELRARADTLETQLTDLRRNTEGRLVRAELKAEAVRAGMIDLDGLRFIDIPSLKINDRGEVEDAAVIMQDLRRSKPWLFVAAGQFSSNPANPPAALPPKQKLATEMTDSEYRVARAAILKHRR